MGQSSITIYKWRIFAILCQRVVNKLQKTWGIHDNSPRETSRGRSPWVSLEQLRGIPRGSYGTPQRTRMLTPET